MDKERLLWADTETTGVDENRHHLTQIAAIADFNGKIEEYNILINPPVLPMDFDLGAGRVTGLTKEILETNGVPPIEAYQSFRDFLSKFIKVNSKKNKFFLAGKNIGFDRRFLEIFFRHHDDEYIKYFFPLELNIDSIAAQLISKGLIDVPNQRLETIANALGVDTSKFTMHDALSDVHVTRLTYKAGLEKLKEL